MVGNLKAQGLQGVVRALPIDKIFLETDAPFMAPQDTDFKQSPPGLAVNVAWRIACLRSQSVHTVLDQTFKNAMAIYN